MFSYGACKIGISDTMKTEAGFYKLTGYVLAILSAQEWLAGDNGGRPSGAAPRYWRPLPASISLSSVTGMERT